jgi:hypothetical protein
VRMGEGRIGQGALNKDFDQQNNETQFQSKKRANAQGMCVCELGDKVEAVFATPLWEHQEKE